MVQVHQQSFDRDGEVDVRYTAPTTNDSTNHDVQTGEEGF